MPNLFLPDPPLRYWPHPCLDQDLPSVDESACNSASLVQHMSRLTELQQIVNQHYHEIVEWTEQCHSQSVALTPRSSTASVEVDWLNFVKQVKEYLNEKVSRRSKQIEEAIQTTLVQMTNLRQGLMARLGELEVQFERTQERRRKLLHEVSTKGDE
jgi:hypothetical protein